MREVRGRVFLLEGDLNVVIRVERCLVEGEIGDITKWRGMEFRKYEYVLILDFVFFRFFFMLLLEGGFGGYSVVLFLYKRYF